MELNRKLDELIDTSMGVAEAKRKLDECRNDCDHDAGYFCHSYQETYENERARFKTAFIEAVKAL